MIEIKKFKDFVNEGQKAWYIQHDDICDELDSAMSSINSIDSVIKDNAKKADYDKWVKAGDELQKAILKFKSILG